MRRMLPALLALSTCMLCVGVLSPRSSAAATEPTIRTPVKPYPGHRPNSNYGLPATTDMPRWARELYHDDVTPNVFEVDRAFQRWLLEEGEQARAHESSGENKWVEYYRRWRREVTDYVQPDGSLDFSVDPGAMAAIEATQARRLASAGAAGAAGVWTSLGPTQAYARKDYHPTKPSPFAYHVNVTAFDVAPSNPAILYCGTSNGIIGKTVDSGMNWTNLGLDVPDFRGEISAVTIDPTTPDRVYVGCRGGVARTLDGGATWTTEVANTGLFVNDIVIRSDSVAQVLVAGNQLLRRANDGTWSTSLARKTYDLAVNPTDPRTIYAVVKGASNDTTYEFYRSTNGGLTWVLRSSGWSLPPFRLDTGGAARMTVTPAFPSLIYVVVLTMDGPRILRSSNLGETCTITAASSATDLTGPCTYGATGPLTLSNGQGMYDLSICASADNSSELVVGTTKLVKSSDGGYTWTEVGGYCGPPDALVVHPDIQEVRSIPGETWIATDGGLSRTTDFFASQAGFSTRTNGLMGTEYWGFAQGWNEDVLVGGRYHNGDGAWREGWPAGKHLQIDGGERATGYVNPGDNRKVYFSDAPGGGQILPPTIDGSVSTFNVTDFPTEAGYADPGDNIPSFTNMLAGAMRWDPRYSNRFYVTRENQLRKTTDGGSSFNTVAGFSPNGRVRFRKFEICRSDPRVIYVCIQDSALASTGLYRTTDGGTTWAWRTMPGGVSAPGLKYVDLTVSGTNSDLLWLCLRNGGTANKVFRSADGGATWTNLTTSTLNVVVPNGIVHQLGTNGGVYLLGDYGRVYYRNDAMPDWVPVGTGLPVQIGTDPFLLSIQYKLKKLRLATVVGLFENDLYEPSTTTIVQPMADRATVASPCDTIQLESYSVVNGNATYHWSIEPPPQWISDPDARNPRVVLGAGPGPYSFTLTVTDDNGVASKTEPALVTNAAPPTVQWASGVVDFSSQYDEFTYPAVQALGPPNRYPQYGDLPDTWASLTPDDQREFLHLSYTNPAPINFVQVVETYSPGAVDRISVRNPNTGQLQLVWQGTAAPAPPVARIRTISFPTTSFPVGEVRVEFDSPAVPDWNEVDAVGIGSCACAAPASLDVADHAGPPSRNQLEAARPNPFTSTVELGFTLARPGMARVEVFSVSGQRVAVLLEGRLAAGRHGVRWDGRDSRGQAAGSGVYYVRFEAGGERLTRKVVRFR